MPGETGASKPIDLLIYGPRKEVIDQGFPAGYVLHKCERADDLEKLSDEARGRIRGIAVTGLVPTGAAMLARFPKLEIVASFGVGYDHVDSAWAAQHGVIVTNTPDVLTEEVADTALGLLIATLREFIRADKYVRAGRWQTQDYPLKIGRAHV